MRFGAEHTGLPSGNSHLFACHTPQKPRKHGGGNRGNDEWRSLIVAAAGFVGYLLCDEWSWRRSHHWSSSALFYLERGFLLGRLSLSIWWLL
jgi:hypothetical protein